MSTKVHDSVRIMNRARVVCSEDGHDWVARHIQKGFDNRKEFVLMIEAPKLKGMSDADWQDSLHKLCDQLAEIPKVERVVTLGVEKLGRDIRHPIRPTAKDKLECARIFEEAEIICAQHGRGTAINAVVPEKDGYLVDINFWPLETKPVDNQKVIIKDIETRIQAIAGVSSLSYAAPCELE
jgi:hypothetical protein